MFLDVLRDGPKKTMVFCSIIRAKFPIASKGAMCYVQTLVRNRAYVAIVSACVCLCVCVCVCLCVCVCVCVCVFLCVFTLGGLRPPPLLKILRNSQPNGGRPLFISIIIRRRSVFDFRHAVRSLPSVDTVPRTVPTVPEPFREHRTRYSLYF